MRPAGHNSGLVYALSSEDQTVQYASALALSSINKYPTHFVGEDKVAAVLGRGVSENKSTYILVADENQNVRNEIRKSLEALGYGMTEAVNGRDALLKAKSFPPKDLIIIGDNLRSDMTTEQVMEELKADVRTRYTPQGVLHDRVTRTATQARFGLDIPLVEREMKDNDLKGAVEKLEAKRAAETVTKRKAHEISVACATALSNLRLNSTNIRLADAVPNAWDALVNRKDDVRIPAAKFIGVAEGGDMKDKSAERLKDVFEDSKNATDLRLAALKSLAQVKPETYQALYIKAQSEPEWVLTYQAAVNFGKHPRTTKELLELLNVKRIDKDKKEK
jgi:CheY-like chemotaxis protein